MSDIFDVKRMPHFRTSPGVCIANSIINCQIFHYRECIRYDLQLLVEEAADQITPRQPLVSADQFERTATTRTNPCIEYAMNAVGSGHASPTM